MAERNPRPRPLAGWDNRMTIGGGVGLGMLAILGFALLRPAPPRRLPVEEESAYQSYRSGLGEIADPKDARTEAQVQQIRGQLEQIRVPPGREVDWSATEAVKRHGELLADLNALDKAVHDLQRRYRDLADEGKQVLKNKDAPKLPERARSALAKARDLPDAGKDGERHIDRSRRLTYATVFAFPSVIEARTEWERVRDELRPLANLDGS